MPEAGMGYDSIVSKYVHWIWFTNCVTYTMKKHLHPYDYFDCRKAG